MLWDQMRTIPPSCPSCRPRNPLSTSRSPNPHQSGHQMQNRNGVRGRLECARCCKQSYELDLRRASPVSPRAGLYRTPLPYGFVEAMHSLARGIPAECKPRYKLYPPCVGRFERASTGHLAPNIRKHACMRDIRNFVSTHPWATILDLRRYRDARLEGVEWAESNSCKQERETGQKLTCGTSASSSCFGPCLCYVHDVTSPKGLQVNLEQGR
jgi:hypothetical protein